MDVIDALKWRYAVKQFDPEKKLSKQQVDLLMEGLCLTATSMGFQLMEFIVVEHPSLKKKLTPIAYNQSQVEDCSHLIILCRKNKVETKDIQTIIQRTSEVRGVDINTPQIKGYEQMLSSTLKMNYEQQVIWMENQVYIALGNLMTICAIEKIDACPMEGFNKEELDEALALTSKGLKSVVLCAVGYRSEKDKYNGLPKVRRKKKKLVTYV